jgi:hypothetical protein
MSEKLVEFHNSQSNVCFKEAHAPRRGAAHVRMARSYLRLHRRATIATFSAVGLLSAVTAGVILLQTVALTPAVKDPDVIFAAGDDFNAIDALDFATLSLGTSATSASLGVSGIAGASDLQLTNLLNITNQHATADYSVSFARSAALDTDIDNFTITLKNETDSTVITWFVKDSASAESFTLPALTTYTIDVRFLVSDGVASGNLDSFDLEFSLAEV